MYGNERLPGISTSETFRYEGSIWRGSPESTWFKVVKVNGDEAAKIPAGTIMKEVASDGSYIPISTSDISSTLPGSRLAIVADSTAKSGTEDAPSKVLIGICGQVDKAKLFVGETAFNDLTDEQKISLNTQLEAWGFLLLNVLQG